MNPREVLQELVSIPGAPGKEELVRKAVEAHAIKLGYETAVDGKGNLLAWTDGVTELPRVVVTAHLDEIAMIVRNVEPNGKLGVTALGGLFPWKTGEGLVTVLGREKSMPGVLSFGSIHTEDPRFFYRRPDHKGVTWESAWVQTYLSKEELSRLGVRPGTRVVVHPDRRKLATIGDHVAGYFLDDRADLVSMLLTMEAVKDQKLDVLFAATTCEEVGGEGALYLMQEIRPEICIALELGPNVPDAPVEITSSPTVWVSDAYSTPLSDDIDLIEKVGKGLGMNLQFQALSRGGSDASCSASHGHCARPFTLGLPMDNSHGYEVMHRDAMSELARLTAALLKQIFA